VPAPAPGETAGAAAPAPPPPTRMVGSGGGAVGVPRDDASAAAPVDGIDGAAASAERKGQRAVKDREAALRSRQVANGRKAGLSADKVALQEEVGRFMAAN